jgi:hypothetical protein
MADAIAPAEERHGGIPNDVHVRRLAIPVVLCGDSARDDALTTTFRERLIEPRHRALTTMVERAVARDELTQDVDAALLVDTLVGPLYHRLLITGEPITAAAADEVAELVLQGANRR